MNLDTKKKLKSLRDSIDRLDTILINTLGERFKQTGAVGILKLQAGLDASDLKRELAQMKRVEKIAKKNNLDPVFAKSLLKFVISEVKQNHNRLQKKNE